MFLNIIITKTVTETMTLNIIIIKPMDIATENTLKLIFIVTEIILPSNSVFKLGIK